jgi:hypothetical protein
MAAIQELPFLEYARIDPRRVMTAEACGECHLSEHAVWEKTPHATGFRTLHRKEQALAIAGKLGFRLIKRDSICFSCHYTPIVERGEIRVDSGVSCESCHGAGRDWIKLHNDYGDGADHRSESAAHRRQRIEASRQAGMRRPSDLYPVVANCFSCHTVPNEELVNVAGHTTGSSDFEFVEWSQGQIRHNFLASTLAGGAPTNAQRPMSRRRLMYVVGRALDLEYSLRGVAEASEDGVYAKAMIRRVRSAVAEMRAVDRAAAIPEVGRMLEVVRQVRVAPGNRAALVAAAESIGALTREFLDSAEPDRLASLDDLVLGRQPEPLPEEPTAVAAGGGGTPPAGESAAAAAAAGGHPPSGGTAAPAAVAPARSTAPTAAAGPLRRRLRPAADHRTVGPGACSGCHTRQNEWWFRDAHYRSADPFFDGDVDNLRIATLYGLSPSQMTVGSNLCMDCHGTVISGKESREVLDGVSCESCHGAAGDWLEPHKDETDKQLGRRRPGHLAALQRGKADLRDLSVRAAACVSCHYVTDPRLLSAGHPSGAEKDWVEAMAKVRHWEFGPAPPTDLRAAYGAALAARGPVPRVERAVLAAGAVVAEPAAVGGGRRRPATSLTGDRRDEPAAVLALRPPPPRPAGPAARGAAAPALGLPPFPEISDALPVDEVLGLLQERLEMLYRLVGQEGQGG